MRVIHGETNNVSEVRPITRKRMYIYPSDPCMVHLAIFVFLILSVSAWMVWFLRTRKVPEKNI